jgi:hypothetical protein
MTMLVLAVDAPKSDNPHDVIRAMCDRARYLGMMLTCTTGKGVFVMAAPGDDADALIAQHDKQAKNNRKIACISDVETVDRFRRYG